MSLRCVTIRTAFLNLGVLLLAGGLASAGERGIPSPERTRSLIREIALYRDSTLEHELIGCLGTLGLAALDDSSRARVRRDLPRFEPLLIASIRPSFVPDESLIRWLWPMASAEGRSGLVDAMLEWLRPGLPSALIASPDSLRLGWEFITIVSQGRIDAARVLAERGEPRAIPLLRDLIEPATAVPYDHAWLSGFGYRAHLELSLQRLEDPRHAGYLEIGDKGRLDVRRGLSEVRETAKGEGSWTGMRSVRRISAEPVGALWSSLRGAPAAPIVAAPAGSVVVLRFDDGFGVRMWPLGADTIAFDDNEREGTEPSLSWRERKSPPPVATAVISRQGRDVLLTMLASDALPWEPSGIPSELRLPFLKDLQRHPSPAKERRFIARLGQADFWQMAFDLAARDWMSAHFDRLGPLVLRAQKPSFLPDRPLIDWTLERSTPAQRETLIQQLLGWLAPQDPRLWRYVGSDLVRTMAADVLADLRVERAAPMIDALLKAGAVHDGEDTPHSAWLRQSYLRLVDSSRAGILRPSTAGDVTLLRSMADVDHVSFGEFRAEEPISATEARGLWDLLASSRTSGETCVGHTPYRLKFAFRDGLSAEVFLSDRQELCYVDDSRPGGSSNVPALRLPHPTRLRLENPALVSRLEELLVRVDATR